MKTRSMSYVAGVVAALGAIGLMMSGSFVGNAFAHAHTTLTPDHEHANPISIVVGHSNEPTFGAKPGIHDGRHALEVFLEDASTTMPLSGAELKADKYYFKDLRSFDRATSLERADEIQRNITVAEVFGDPGHYMARQVMQPGIYGYHIYGTVDYFGVAEVPIDTTVFCTSDDGNTTKFNSDGWGGAFGCTENVDDIYFPNRVSLIRQTDDADSNEGQLQPVSVTGGSAASNVAVQGGIASLLPILPILAAGAVTSVAGFFGLRALRHRNRDSGL